MASLTIFKKLETGGGRGVELEKGISPCLETINSLCEEDKGKFVNNNALFLVG